MLPLMMLCLLFHRVTDRGCSLVYNVSTTKRCEHINVVSYHECKLTFAPIGVIKRDVGAIARRLIADSSEDIFPDYDGSCSS